MSSANEPQPATKLQDVNVVRSSTTQSSAEQGWYSSLIYRWKGTVTEVWMGPSSHGPDAPGACQLKQGTAEVAFLDLGAGRSTLGRRTGTVLGELVSFEQERRGWLPPRTIDVRLAIKQHLILQRGWRSTTLLRENNSVVASLANDRLRVDSNATQAEGIAAILMHASGLLGYLDSPIKLIGKPKS